MPERLACRDVRVTGAFQEPVSIRWNAPSEGPEHAKLRDWCQAVGPAIVYAPEGDVPSRAHKGRILLVGWNVHVGNGEIPKLRTELMRRERQAGHGDPDFVMLIEEAFRRGIEVPSSFPSNSAPGRITPGGKDIEDLARELGWWLYYVPSMRNGGVRGSAAEDRGNAVLSSLPLENFTAVELPFVVQRRVAAVATVNDKDRGIRFNVAAVHLDTRAPVFDGWYFGAPGARERQARGFVETVAELHEDGLPLFIGADLNTQRGPSERAVRTLTEHVQRWDCEGESTHRFGFTLDHMFYFGLPKEWRPSSCVRWDDRLNSDHYPLVVALDARSASD